MTVLKPIVLDDEVPVPADLAPILVRLAHEGVPIRAMARAFLRHVEPIRECVRSGLASGELSETPRDDWPPGARPEDRLPAGRRVISNADLSGILAHQFKLTSKEADVLTMLMKRPGSQSKNAILDFVYGHSDETPEAKIIDVFICKLRKKLEPHRVAITTVWGKGYTLENEDRVKINGIIDGYLADQKKAVAA